MNPHEFLAETLSSWPLLPDTALDECNEEERALVRGAEAEGIKLEFEALSDIILHCHNKYQFAKTYKVLRADLRNTFTDSRELKIPSHVDAAIRAALEQIVRQKLHEMARWFYEHFADDHDLRQLSRRQQGQMSLADIMRTEETVIEVYAGKEGASGCAGVVVFALVATSLGSLAVGFLL